VRCWFQKENRDTSVLRRCHFERVALGSAEFDVLGYFGSVVEQRDTASVAKVTILKVSKGSRERPILIGSNLARVEDALQRREPSDVKHSA
jgi:hypothetical protein